MGMSEQQPGGGATPGYSEEELKRAMTMFRKRLKFTKLDMESKLGAHRPMTSGKKADVQGIIPPREIRPEVWAELARQKKLKDMGGGFYSLP
jgi:hypothetical protein